MISFQKTKPYRSEKYKKFIRSKRCLKCGGPPNSIIDIVPAHQNFGFGGMGTKAPDIWTVPLCVKCHSFEHIMGHESFWGGIDLKLACYGYIKEYYGAEITDRCAVCVKEYVKNDDLMLRCLECTNMFLVNKIN